MVIRYHPHEGPDRKAYLVVAPDVEDGWAIYDVLTHSLVEPNPDTLYVVEATAFEKKTMLKLPLIWMHVKPISEAA